jgi:hypothetical protein
VALIFKAIFCEVATRYYLHYSALWENRVLGRMDKLKPKEKEIYRTEKFTQQEASWSVYFA